MKTVLKKLKKTREQIVNHTEKRDASALSRSDNWLESVKGKTYEAKTGLLADSVDGIDEAIKYIESFLE